MNILKLKEKKHPFSFNLVIPKGIIPGMESFWKKAWKILVNRKIAKGTLS